MRDRCPTCGHIDQAWWFWRWLRVMLRMRPLEYRCTSTPATSVTGWGSVDACGCEDPFHAPPTR